MPSCVDSHVANGAVVMPGLGGAVDVEARRIVAGLLPRRRVVQVAKLAPAWANGNIHCVTQQQPVCSTVPGSPHGV